MSYILDALRKAERDRHESRVPTLATVHGGAESARRLPWAWVVTGALALSMLVGYGLFWAAGRPVPPPEAAPPPAAVAAVGPGPSSTSVGSDAPPPTLERPPERDEPAAHAPARPPVARAAPPGRAPRAMRAEESRRAPVAARPPETPDSRSAAADPRPAPSPATVAPIGSPEVPSGGDAAAQPVNAPAPVTDAVADRPTSPAPVLPLPRLTLDVLVYSDIPAERLVFLNGRKYVEGQTVDGNAVIEQITPEGAVLRHEGKQFVLRPKLNPYARPGSP